MKTYLANKTTCKLLGRASVVDNILWLAYSGSGVEFQVTATKVELSLIGDSVAAKPDQEGNYTRYAIYLDGERVFEECLKEAQKTVCVFEGAKLRTATVALIKLSEAAMSTMAIKEIRLSDEGSINPTPNKKWLIEFVGDSITCGYGVDDEDKDHHFSTATEDTTKAYAYRTAELLSADYRLVCLSGYGIISGYSGDGVKRADQTIPPYYDKLGFSYGQLDGKAPSDYYWDFNQRQPNLVVVNLGTNDHSYCGTDEERRAEFITKYVEFLQTVRDKNPKAHILCVLGTMAEELYCCVETAVKNYTDKTGDTVISLMKLKQHTEADGYSADWHPSQKTQEKTAELVAEKIRTILGD